MTILNFAWGLWDSCQPFGYIAIGVWVIVMIDFIERHRGKKIKGQAGQIIHPQEEGMGQLQPVYQNEGLPENNGDDRPRRLRHMPQDVRV